MRTLPEPRVDHLQEGLGSRGLRFQLDGDWSHQRYSCDSTKSVEERARNSNLEEGIFDKTLIHFSTD